MRGDNDVGIVGLGVTGRSLALAIAGRGYTVAGYDSEVRKAERLAAESDAVVVRAARDQEEFVASLAKPRLILLRVPAGEPVDEVIGALAPLLQPGDTIIDCGDSHFRDTESRANALAPMGIQYMGAGIVSADTGIHHGACIMASGARDAYERARMMLEAIAARVDDAPSAVYLGAGPAGHYVKMVHDGLARALRQLLAESRELLIHAAGMHGAEAGKVFQQWNEGDLEGYLLHEAAMSMIEQERPAYADDRSAESRQSPGAEAWTTASAMQLRIPTPSIDSAIAVRHLGAWRNQHTPLPVALEGPGGRADIDRGSFTQDLAAALQAGYILTFTQGFALLAQASRTHAFGLSLAEVARVWRGGSIIRTRLLHRIRAAFHSKPSLELLPADRGFAADLSEDHRALRRIVAVGVAQGVPVPCLSACLAYYDGLRSANPSP
jgi:6-phosphogluconate dehydrogenase